MAGREVVIWSGGVDSTLILHKLATNSTEHWPVVALTVEGHPQIDKGQFACQYTAQQAYLKLAKSRGYHVSHVRVHIKSNGNAGGDNPQAMLWFATMMPYIENNDRVHLGYIRPDEFWHLKGEFTRAFEAMCRFKGVKAELIFDLEWVTKLEVVQELQKLKVPPECVWTCDHPVTIDDVLHPCGTCTKCKALLEACAELAKVPKPTKIQVVGTPVVLKGKKPKPVRFRW